LTVRFTPGTIEYLKYPVSADRGDTAIEPSDYPVYFAFPDPDVAPVEADWQPGDWEADGDTDLARILVGPDGGVVVPDGWHDVWLRIVDAPEHPERRVDRLFIGAPAPLADGPNAPRVGPCSPWTNTSAARACGDCGSADDVLLAQMIDVASYALWACSAQMFPGACEDTVTPLPRHARTVPVTFGFPVSGRRYGSRVGPCGCGTTGCEVGLGVWPVTAILQVKIGGQTLDPAEYQVNDWRWLVRRPDAQGRRRHWPHCPYTDRPTTEAGTFTVTFGHGMAPPPPGVLACQVLACQLALSCDPGSEGDCRLPAKVTQVTRQGVSISMQTLVSFLEKGETGIWQVDLFLGSVNPGRVRAPAQVLTAGDWPDVVHVNTGA